MMRATVTAETQAFRLTCLLSINWSIEETRDDLLHDVEVHIQVLPRTGSPVLLVAHQQDVGSHFTQPGGLQEGSGTVLETGSVHHRVKRLDFVRSEPGGTVRHHTAARFVRYRCLKRARDANSIETYTFYEVGNARAPVRSEITIPR